MEVHFTSEEHSRVCFIGITYYKTLTLTIYTHTKTSQVPSKINYLNKFAAGHQRFVIAYKRLLKMQHGNKVF